MQAEAFPATPGFVPAVLVPDVVAPGSEAARPRIEVVLGSGRKIIVEGGVDIDAVLKLARGLEALR